MTCRAVITCGGRVDDAFAREIGTGIKALARFGAGVLLDPVLTALRGAGIEEIALVADADVAPYARGARLIAADADGAVNVVRALDAFADGDLLYATSDLPFVDAAAIGAFLDAARGCDVAMPLADGAAYAAAYPGASEHVTTLGGERIANGSVFFLSARARPALRALAPRFFTARKSLVAMARLLGPALLLRFALGRLRIGDVERRGRAILGLDLRAIRDMPPSLCYDVDSFADYEYACRTIAGA